jgi:hypothetical protein
VWLAALALAAAIVMLCSIVERRHGENASLKPA